jgi:hypothetical protein
MAFVTYWLEKDALKALSGILSDGKGTILEVSLPKEKPQAPKATTWEGGYEELKLYVTGISTLTSKSEVLGEFMKDGDCEVHMMQNTAFVNYTTKKNAARAIKRLHNKLIFPGSSRYISVRYARKKTYNTPSAKKPPSQKLSKVTWSFYSPHFSTIHLVFSTAHRQLLHTHNYVKNRTRPPAQKINETKSHRR